MTTLTAEQVAFFLTQYRAAVEALKIDIPAEAASFEATIPGIVIEESDSISEMQAFFEFAELRVTPAADSDVHIHFP